MGGFQLPPTSDFLGPGNYHLLSTYYVSVTLLLSLMPIANIYRVLTMHKHFFF